MNRSRRHRAGTIRLLFLALVALAMILRPTLSSIGEAHEWAHHGGDGHALVDTASAAGDRPGAGTAEEEGGGGTLHVLSHFAHCCGQGSIVVPHGPASIAASLRIVVPARQPPTQLAAGRWPTPFRPPIVA